jgi:hypothetical protein
MFVVLFGLVIRERDCPRKESNACDVCAFTCMHQPWQLQLLVVIYYDVALAALLFVHSVR